MAADSATIDRVDAQILRCLQLAPRLPFSAAAEILGVSEQTVARRYRRMVADGVARVVAVTRPAGLGQTNWLVRIQCKPSGATSLAQALAQRDDISWVTLVSGGAEIVCVLRSRTQQAREDLLMQRLPRTAPVLGISAAMVLHRFVGGGGIGKLDWTAFDDVLRPDQEQAVLRHAEQAVHSEWAHLTLDADDLAILEVVSRDARASMAAIAAGARMSGARVARRLRALLEGGAFYIDVDIAVGALDFRTGASVWLTVAPAELHRAGQALSEDPRVAFAAAVTGPQNLAASVVCRDIDGLYSFVTERVGSIAGVQSLEVSPVLRHVKQAGVRTDGNWLATR